MQPFSKIVIYSTLGALYLIPAAKFKKLWLYEHIYKMIGAFSALLAAFAGTVFSSYQPYSQILPSALGILLQMGFITFYVKRGNLINQ